MFYMILFLTVVILVLFLLGLLLYCWKFRSAPCRSFLTNLPPVSRGPECGSPSANGIISYSAVSTQDGSPQDTQRNDTR
ncbi:PREDICTED: poliovirus receptor-like [Propithecus coquereli]|uniref:poliovirus receptor-like n=1 Tax=Propithecus coquereli TaxID=379532 RepID=UPI00063F91C0|nr:PREDICTED: poliovirus receptor-like [Propithecus coquereli]